MIEWDDATGYSQNDKEKVPRSWEVYPVEELRVVVHRLHGLDGWFLSCYELGLRDRQLVSSSDDGEHAKQMGAQMMRTILQKRIERYEAAIAKLSELR